MQDKRLNLKVDFNGYINSLNSEIDSHFVSLKTTLKSIENISYLDHQTTGNTMVRMIISKPNPELFKKQEINKSFKEIICSLQDFMDKLIAVSKISKEQIIIKKSITDDEELRQFLFEVENSFIQKISKDKSLTSPKKLELFKLGDIELNKIIKNYFEIRNSLEHHKGIADREMILTCRKVIICVQDKEVELIPFDVEGGESITMKSKDVSRNIPINSQIEITETEIEETLTTIKVFIATALVAGISSSINKQ